jgi:hypothetical protein
MSEFPHSQIHPGHGQKVHPKRQTSSCPLGESAHPRDPIWRPSPAIIVTDSVTQTEIQTAIGSYTTTVTMTLSHLTGTSTLSNAGGIETASLPGETGDSTSTNTSDIPLVSSIISELSAFSSLTQSSSSHLSTAGTSHSLHSSTSSVLRTDTSTAHNGTLVSSTHAGTVAGATIGSAGAIGLLFLLCCICVRRRKKKVVVQEDKELKRQLKEAAAVQEERNKALRALESRRTGAGSDGAWVSSPRYSTGWPLRREA